MINDKFITELLRRGNKMPIKYLSDCGFNLVHTVVSLDLSYKHKAEIDIFIIEVRT